MSRRVDKPIPNPVLDGNRRPLSFRHAGQLLRVVEVLDRWVETGMWWEGEKETIAWRVQVANGGIYDLHHRDGAWRLYWTWD